MTRTIADNILDHPCWKSATVFLKFPDGPAEYELMRESAVKICDGNGGSLSGWEWADCTSIGSMVEHRVLIRRSECEHDSIRRKDDCV